jgi:hypothetical protein
MENVNPLNPKQLGTYQKLPRPANHFTQGAEKNSPHPQTWRKIGKREKCGLGCFSSTLPQNRHPERSASHMDRVTQRWWRGVEGPRHCFAYPMLLGAFRPPKPDNRMTAENVDVGAGH